MTDSVCSGTVKLPIGVQTYNVVNDREPVQGFEMLKRAGFSCCDFSLNAYLPNTALYRFQVNDFFDRSNQELARFFTPLKDAAEAEGITINQIHMPYPNYVPRAPKEMNDYLQKTVAPRSMEICAFLGCPYIVVHGFKLAHYLGSEEAEWERTEEFLDTLAPLAKELGVTICMENLYHSVGNRLMEGPCCDAEKAVRRIDAMNTRYGVEVLGFCFDTGHANLIGINPEEFITTLGDRLKVLHIHDNDGIEDLHQIPFTFTGNRENLPSTDWRGFLKGLGRIRFGGVLSFETAPVLRAFPEVMRQDVLHFLANIGEYFAGEILHDSGEQ